MTLAELVAELDALRAEYGRLDAYVKGADLLDLVIEKLHTVDPDADPLDGPDLTTAEAGELLGLAAKTVERLCRNDEIRARKTSERGEWRVSRAALHEYRTGRKRKNGKPDLKIWRE